MTMLMMMMMRRQKCTNEIVHLHLQTCSQRGWLFEIADETIVIKIMRMKRNFSESIFDVQKGSKTQMFWYIKSYSFDRENLSSSILHASF